MINPSELIFVVDENNNPQKPQVRSFAHKNNYWHRTSGIWVVNKDKEILCQKRSMKKDSNPGIWEAFFGGHLLANEEYIDNAVGEVGEELGLTIKADELIPYKVLASDKPTHREFQGIFVLPLEKENIDFQYEKDEIDELSWKSIDELRQILLSGKNPAWVQKPWDKEILDWLEILV